MDELFLFQDRLLNQLSTSWKRYLFPKIPENERLLGIKGLRGVGKTTMLLQYAAERESSSSLYVTADHPYFYQHSLYDLAEQWEQQGGQMLLIDEVHKYPNWSRELKLMYDAFPRLQVLFTSSSALELYKGESDLSRRLLSLSLNGLSFREFLSFHQNIHFPSIKLTDLLSFHRQIAQEVNQKIRPLPLFKQYLREGYFPFSKEVQDILPRLYRTINTVLESDLASIQDYSPSNVQKIKKLLAVIAESAPFAPNISGIANKLGIGRTTVYTYLKNLEDASLLNFIRKQGKGITALQKPDKIYLENTSLNYALQPQPEMGNLRETFFLNQLKNAEHQLMLPECGDFEVDQTYIFEIGGRNKGPQQILGLDNAYVVKDDMETGFGTTIPLWLFGFLY